jgi:hypothetical protein
MTFKELRDYSALDLLENKKEKYEYNKFSVISIGEEIAFFNESIILDKKIDKTDNFKGVVAFKGFCCGVVKVVMTASEIGKVTDRDILVAPTTAPSYIMGMKKAAAEYLKSEGKEELIDGINNLIDQTFKHSEEQLEIDEESASSRHYMWLESDHDDDDDYQMYEPKLAFHEDDMRARLEEFLKDKM